AVVAAPQHFLGLLRGSGVIEIGREEGAITFENFPDQKKIFFLAADEQHPEERKCGFGSG
ncbi:MAG: hypothetical protein WAK56_21230, partial [Candidatus Sulfotelmatobacter sp.]